MLIFFQLIRTTQNYASSACGANILQSSKNLERVTSVISPKSDHYLVGTCVYSFITIKLAQEIKINQIEVCNQEWLANFVTKVKFSILVDNHYTEIGTFKLTKTRKKQAFNLNVKYYTSHVTCEFLEFVGKHDFFTFSNIKIFGTTLNEEFAAIYNQEIIKKIGGKKCPSECLKFAKKSGEIIKYKKDLIVLNQKMKILKLVCFFIVSLFTIQMLSYIIKLF